MWSIGLTAYLFLSFFFNKLLVVGHIPFISQLSFFFMYILVVTDWEEQLGSCSSLPPTGATLYFLQCGFPIKLFSHCCSKKHVPDFIHVPAQHHCHYYHHVHLICSRDPCFTSDAECKMKYLSNNVSDYCSCFHKISASGTCLKAVNSIQLFNSTSPAFLLLPESK